VCHGGWGVPAPGAAQIILPVAVPGLVTATLFSFTLSWGEMIYAVSFISATPLKTLPIGVATSLVRGDVYFWGRSWPGHSWLPSPSSWPTPS
jgi:multiple sugar transport system permease protein